MNWTEELEKALEEFRLAEESFHYAEPEFCDLHIYRMQAAEERINMIIRQAKTESGLSLKVGRGLLALPFQQLAASPFTHLEPAPANDVEA